MNEAKFAAVHRGLTAQAKKVYEALPIAEAWSPSQIMQELHRKNCGLNDMRVVIGCINSMIDAGCVIEPSKGVFKRTEIRVKQEEKESPVIKNTKEMTMKANVLPTVGPIDRLSVLASRLRELATDMETTALELAEQAEKNDTDTAKMRQLQALLKSLG